MCQAIVGVMIQRLASFGWWRGGLDVAANDAVEK